ncbi:hypothetical protein [Stenotrophomonas tuberculopleuritidis]|uniref:hypothetical protein n=1 Tax=Stenotrophomonas tuberculopleuritidis TaxID=3055079 RepID=UPI0026E58938|nr:hypothetical protein [Stenotrophomonas sp. 704A1]
MNARPPGPPSAAYRYLFVLALGLLVGGIATVMALRALQARRDPFPDSLMQVMQHQAALLQRAQQQDRCSRVDSTPRLQALRLLSNELDLAFPGLKDNTRFQEHARRYRAHLDAALTAAPADCPALARRVQVLQDDCRACHQDFR